MSKKLFKGDHGTYDSVCFTSPVSRDMARKKSRPKRRRQQGGARFRRKPRLIDKIAEGVAMGLSGPAPSFAKAAAFLGKQAFKGIKDNVQHYRRRTR